MKVKMGKTLRTELVKEASKYKLTSCCMRRSFVVSSSCTLSSKSFSLLHDYTATIHIHVCTARLRQEKAVASSFF